MIGVVDYGVGNVRAILNIYEFLGIEAVAARTSPELRRADRVVLPGVGAFDWAMERLNRSGMRDELDDMVRRQGVPVLGICVGMQMMMEGSEEGVLEGLGWFEGGVRRLDGGSAEERMPLPHMGWNDVSPVSGVDLFESCGPDMRFYFLHSYVADPVHSDDVSAVTDYGGRFPAAIRKSNVLGVQFHPEKSHHWGVRLLETFAGSGC